MLKPDPTPELRERLDALRRDLQTADVMIQAVTEHPDAFEFIPGEDSLEFKALKPVDGRPNRAMLKLFKIQDGPMAGREALFFYKKSQIPWSVDRFSYGVCMCSPGGTGDEAGWLDYASEGFDPDRVPKQLRRAFTFTVPE